MFRKVKNTTERNGILVTVVGDSLKELGNNHKKRVLIEGRRPFSKSRNGFERDRILELAGKYRGSAVLDELAHIRDIKDRDVE